jgi:antitoxin component of MazEF toxin-antitoxin module
MKVNKKYSKPAEPFFNKLMNDPEVRFRYKESKAKSKTSKAKLTLKSLLAKVRPENLHGETQTGHAVGKEVW